jgi:hypothetical protein
MLKILVVLMLIASPASAMTAQTKQDVLNAVAFRLTLAYHCIPITGDRAAYEKAKTSLPAILAKAGVTSPTFAELVKSIESQKQDSSKTITKQLCNGLLSLPIAVAN